MFERGHVLVVPFPFSDLKASKRRPVLALTGPDRQGDFIALAITSRPHHAQAIAISEADLLTGSLPVASPIRTDRIVTLNSSLIIKSLAQASEPVIVAAIRRLCQQLGLA